MPQTTSVTKTFIDLVQHFNVGSIEGNTQAKIQNIQFNSNSVKKNSMFFALQGQHTDGHLYIEHAISKGASAIVCSPEHSIDEKIKKKRGYSESPTWLYGEFSPKFLPSSTTIHRKASNSLV